MFQERDGRCRGGIVVANVCVHVYEGARAKGRWMSTLVFTIAFAKKIPNNITQAKYLIIGFWLRHHI